jgi:rubrerythrin
VQGLRLTRGEALLRGALAAGAAYGLPAITPYVRSALAAGEENEEVRALNLALSFELIERKFYEEAKKRLKPTGSLGQMIDLLAEDERQHVEALTAQIEKLGGTPEPEGEYAFSYIGAYEALRHLRDIEYAGLRAYNGAIPSVKSEEALKLMASIAQVEGRHVAAVRMERGGTPAPLAFDPGQSNFQARSSVVKFTGGWEAQ